MRAAVCARENLNPDGASIVLLTVEEEGLGGYVLAGVVDKARALQPKPPRQAQPLRGAHGPWSERDHDRICEKRLAADFDAPDGVSLANEPGDLAMMQSRAVLLGCAHHAQSECAWMNDRGRLGRAQLRSDDYTVGKPIQLRRAAPRLVALRHDHAAIRGHALITPAADLLLQPSMQRKASPRQSIKRASCTPVECQEAAGLARRGRRHPGALDHGHIDPAAREETGGACANRGA